MNTTCMSSIMIKLPQEQVKNTKHFWSGWGFIHVGKKLLFWSAFPINNLRKIQAKIKLTYFWQWFLFTIYAPTEPSGYGTDHCSAVKLPLLKLKFIFKAVYENTWTCAGFVRSHDQITWPEQRQHPFLATSKPGLSVGWEVTRQGGDMWQVDYLHQDR